MSRTGIFTTFGLALSYALTAQLGLQFPVSPDTSITLLSPPAGIALVAVLLLGWRALPGIILGALFASFWQFRAETGATLIGAGLTLSVASSAAALLAGQGLKRIARNIPQLGAAKILLSFVLLAFACLIDALGCVASLYLVRALPVDLLLASVGIHWLGEFSSMLIIGPGLWLFVSFLDSSNRNRESTLMTLAWLINGIFTVLALVTFVGLWNYETDRMSSILARDAALTAEELGEVVFTLKRDMEAIRALMYASERVDGYEFELFTTAILEGRKFGPVAQAVGFLPRVRDRAAWEAQMHRAGYPWARLYEVDRDGQPAPVAPRAEYYPIQYIQPLSSVNKRAVGFDMFSEESRRRALQDARDRDDVGMVAPIFLVQLDTPKPAVLVCLPIYKRGVAPDSVEARQVQLLGFASGVYLIDTLFDKALSRSDEDIKHHLFDTGLPATTQWYATRPSSPGTDERVSPARPTLTGLTEEQYGTAAARFYGYTWQVVTTPGPDFVRGHRTWIPWGAALFVLVVGIALSGIVTERVTARRSMEAEREKTEQALRNTQAAIDSKAYFMTAAAHDIKQPLYALRILVDTLMMSDLTEPVLPLVKSLGKSIDEMSRHFDTLMDVGRFQDGNFDVKRSKFGLGELARRIDLEIAPLCAEKGLAWSIHMDDVLVFTDRELLLRLLRNLLMNAVSYTASGAVQCSARVEHDTVRFEVSDTGCGMEADQQSAVFEQFVRLEQTGAGVTGHGLGLSIARKISQALDLELQMVSVPDAGTRFRFQMPAISQPR